MWYPLDCCDYYELGYRSINGRFEDMPAGIVDVPDDDGYISYRIHCDGTNFSEYTTGPFNITPMELAGMIQSHVKYDGSPVRLLACRAGSEGNHAAADVAFYLRVNVKAAINTVYINDSNGKLLVLPSGLSPRDIDTMIEKRDPQVSDANQYTQWWIFEPNGYCYPQP